MTSLTRKICIVGDFAVGKTSTVERFVNNHFSDKYLTTVGVKVDTKAIKFEEPELTVKLIIWDVAGADSFGPKELAYLRGASAHIFVVDGTRSATAESARKLRDQIHERYDVKPNVLLLNKSDLRRTWHIDDRQIAQLQDEFDTLYVTSAKTGDNVELALNGLAKQIVAADLTS
ncbi:MAG: Rab family GTPase [Pseudomonadota bacterium]